MSSQRKQLRRALLATSCLTVLAVGSVQAATIYTEGLDLSNDLDSPTSLETGVTSVIGHLTDNFDSGTDIRDTFKLSGLAPEQVFSATLTVIGLQGEGGIGLCPPRGVGAGCVRPGEILDFTSNAQGMATFFIQGEGDFYADYRFNVDTGTAAVPIAPSAALLGLGLAAMAAKRRKHHGK
jgi:hypothetical protein